MSACTDSRFADMLHHYELGMLSDDLRQQFEMHLLECEQCFLEAERFRRAAALMRHDPDIARMARRAAGDDEPDARTRRGLLRSRTLRVGLAAAAVLALLILRPWQIRISQTDEAIAQQNRIAVIYFENLTGQDDADCTGEVVANLLIADLSESDYLRIVSGQRLYDLLKLLGREGAKTLDRDVATEVARRAGARWMITGSVLQLQPRLVVTSQTVEVISGDAVASHRVVSLPPEDIFSLADRLSTEIKGDLTLPAEARREPDRPVAEVTTHSPEAYRHYLDGLECHSQYYWREAAACFEEALRYDSTFAMAYYYLSSLKDRDLISRAVAYSDKASHRERLYIESRAALLAGERDRAAHLLEDLLEEFPEEKLALVSLARLKSSAGLDSDAIALYQRAIQIDPLYKQPYNALAYIYERTGNIERAIWALDRYIELAPDEANPYDSKGQILARHGRLDEAIRAYRRALDIKPDYSTSLMYLGLMYLFRGDYLEADSCLRALTRNDSPRIRSAARMYRAYIPLIQGRFRQTLSAYDEVIRIDSAERHKTGVDHTEWPHALKAYVLAEIGENDQALRETERAIEIRQRVTPLDSATHMDAYIYILALDGQFEEAERAAKALRRFLETRDLDLGIYWFAAGSISLTQGWYGRAVDCFEQASATRDRLEVHYQLACAYLAAGRISEAISRFEALLLVYDSPRASLGHWSAKAHYHLGIAYEQADWPDNAVAEYRTFLDLWRNADPGIAEIRDAQTRLTRLTTAP